MRTQTPRGVKDFLPSDARWKLQLEQSIRQVMEQWGYAEVVTPAFEYFETLNLGDSGDGQTLKFLDVDGRLLALRPDMTTPIARMVASRFSQLPPPLRFGYLANVFRPRQDAIGRDREFFQAGVECIGTSNPAADAEVIALAASFLESVSLEEYSLNLGHVEFFRALLEECPDASARRKIRRSFLHQDYVGLRDVLAESPLPQWVRSILQTLPRSHGKREVLNGLRQETKGEAALAALDNMESILDHLEGYGLTDRISLDFSMVKSLDYYTGVIMEGYAPNLGFPLLSGGRYDNLHEQFGQAAPAVGFALGLERLMEVLRIQGLGVVAGSGGLLVCSDDGQAALAEARTRRKQGERVLVDLDNMNDGQAKLFAAAHGLERVLRLEKGSEHWLSPISEGGR